MDFKVRILQSYIYNIAYICISYYTRIVPCTKRMLSRWQCAVPFWLKSPRFSELTLKPGELTAFLQYTGGKNKKKKKVIRFLDQVELMDEKGLSKLPGLSTLPRALGTSDMFLKRAHPPERGVSQKSGRGDRRTRSRHRRRRRRRDGSARREKTSSPAENRSRRAVEDRKGRVEDGSWERISNPEYQLGATSGVIAAGAWGARLEIAGLLEAGCTSEQLLRMIRSGEESSKPLQLSGPTQTFWERSTERR